MPSSPSVSGQVKNGCIKRMMGDISPENYPPPTPIRRNPSTTSSSRRPNYLKASTGSCHDFCKFGKAYSSDESKPRIPFQRRAASKSVDDQVIARRNNETSPQVKKRAIKLRSKSFPAPQSCNLDPISSNVRKVKPLQLDRRKSLLVNDKLVLKPSCSNLSKPHSRPLVIERVLSQRKERILSGTPISLPVKSIYVAARRVVKSKEDVKENKSLTCSSSNSQPSFLHTTRRSIEAKKPLAAATLSSKPVMGKRRTIKSVDPSFSVGKRFIPRKEKKATKDATGVDKASKDNEEESCELVDNDEYMVEIAVTAMSVPNSPALSFQEEENDGKMISSSLVSIEEEEELVMENGNGRKASSSSEIPEEEDEVDEATRSKGIGVEEDGKPVKLQFRRGKLVELEMERDNGGRRLRFRRVTRIGEKEDGNAVVALKKIIMDGGDEEGCLLNNGCDAKVVLRHSDHQHKKKQVEASLLNNVIEETASKLVETRKSKVKALVGAFETVMSFTDTNPNPSPSPII